MKDGKPLRKQSWEGLVHDQPWGGRGSGGAKGIWVSNLND